MGMYNEVFDKCPECGSPSGYLQISQIVLGFGGFDISDLADLKRRYDEGDLSAKDLSQLAEALEGEYAVFRCKSTIYGDEEGCCRSKSWRADPAKIAAIRMLATVNIGDTQARAMQLLTDAGILRD